MGMTDGKRADMEDAVIVSRPDVCIGSKCGRCWLSVHERWTIGCNVPVEEVSHGN